MANFIDNPMVTAALKIFSPVMEKKLVPIIDQIQKFIDDGTLEKFVSVIEKLDTMERATLDILTMVREMRDAEIITEECLLIVPGPGQYRDSGTRSVGFSGADSGTDNQPRPFSVACFSTDRVL